MFFAEYVKLSGKSDDYLRLLFPLRVRSFVRRSAQHSRH